MQFTVLAISTLLGFSLAAPNTLLNKRDQFNKCSVFGSNCAIDGNRFCDADTGKMSICHQIGWGSDECWVQYTMDPCGAAKREPEPAVQVEKRDEFNKCSVFGSNCAVDGNEFCDSDTGKMSICHQIGWGSGECWVQYTMEACPAKREAEPEVAAPIVQKREPVEKRDLFNKCVTFGNDCAVDENVFCRNGRKSICHQIGWGTDDCWIQYTAESC